MKKKKKNSSNNWSRSGKFNRHHIKPKSRSGGATKMNLLIMDTERHKAWHFLFGLMTFREVAELLLRTCGMKGQSDS